MKKCLHCERPISNKKKFCNKKCRDNYHYNKNKVEKICPTCNKKMITTKNKTFCSLQCSYKNREKTMKICPVCKKRFKGISNRIYCSKKCSDIVNNVKKGIKYSNCVVCGGYFKNFLDESKKTCSKECAGKLIDHTKELILMRAFATTDSNLASNYFIKRSK